MNDPQPEAPGVQKLLSKKKLKKAKKVTRKIAVVPGSTDVMVQHTNDDSVVSKRSAVVHGYMADPFLRHFVKKPSRRSPLINRGYYLRMHVITDVVTRCIQCCIAATPESNPVQVISLGAGYDTLAQRLVLGVEEPNRTLRERVLFFDVDFPAVMQAKAALMEAAPPGTYPASWTITKNDPAVPVSSTSYLCLGVDLREAEDVLLHRLQESCARFGAAHPTIIYAECVMQYMPPESATALIAWVAKTFPNAVFVAYDQVHPADSFGSVMQKSLKQKNSPLLGIDAAPDGRSMTQRALNSGMSAAYYANFYDLTRHYISGAESLRVEALEPFDEMEEWSEMCEHYGITLATTTSSSPVSDVFVTAQLPSFASAAAVLAASSRHRLAGETANPLVTAEAHLWPSGRFGFEGWGNGQVYAERVGVDNDVVIVSFGGFSASKAHQRVNMVFAHSLQHGELQTVNVGDVGEPPALIFHSFTRLAPFVYVVMGGRTNPGNVSDAIYLVCGRATAGSGGRGGEASFEWKALTADGTNADRPQGRYRHIAAALSGSEVFVHGGRAASGEILGDTWLASISAEAGRVTWKRMQTREGEGEGGLPCLCSAAAVVLCEDEVLLSGGLCAADVCNGALWRVNTRTGAAIALSAVSIGHRYSHSMTHVTVNEKDCVLVLGGSWDHEKRPEHTAVLLHLPDLQTVTPVALPSSCPSWSRHCCLALGPHEKGTVAIVGGGYTCFSFGTFTSRPLILTLGDTATHTQPFSWRGGVARVSGAAAEVVASGGPAAAAALLPSARPPVLEMAYGTEAFTRVATAASQPVIFRNVPLGPCVEKWCDPAYLRECDADTVVSVHIAPGSHLLDFVRKNFAFQHVRFRELINHTEAALAHYREHGCQPDETWYYRSIATHMKSERANVWTDFQTLGKDFALPEGGAREYITPRIHQSCLRINAPPLQLWTHYDTLDNVLCQVVGRKRVVLFPPSEYNNLYMVGSSSPITNLDAPDLRQYPRFIDAYKRAVEVIMNPGDMLYFPAQWFHHVTTLDDNYSVSVNVFFEHFDRADYDPKDLYGNKDLPACVSLKEDIVRFSRQRLQEAKLTGSGKAIPPEYTEFTLRRAIQELEQIADMMAAERRAERA